MDLPVALITGASRGIGRGITLALAQCGFHTIVNYASNESAALQTAEESKAGCSGHEHPPRSQPCQADIGTTAGRKKLLDYAKSEFGRLDILINNAGVAPAQRKDLLEMTEEGYDLLLNTNLKGPFFLTQMAARWMIDQQPGHAGYSPKIVNISSISAYTASVQRGEYCIGKAGLSMVTRLFAARLAGHGIQVFEIRPGLIATDMTATVKEKYQARINEGLTPIRRWGTPEDIGKAVTAIAQDHFPFSTGEVMNVDGGFHLRTL